MLKIKQAIETELEKMPKWQVLMFLQKNGVTSVYSLAKQLNWPISKTHSVVSQLEKSSAIKSNVVLVNGRAVKKISLVG
jgi:DNA-binding Lrp family transcriptional regulator